ncbi:nuclear receptor subfamily 6 group A member 1-like [Amphiura filiformis]|uniref:nuclear receptor subfamily 6 group A member 1-like n=1 Tax=Amphiura filiformis TaxID=82378 RepID=UPI003B218878
MISYRWGAYGYPSTPNGGPLPQGSADESPLNFDFAAAASKVYANHVTPPSGGGAVDDSKTCLICGDRATGLHYGIVSCEGCKGFFKRSICNKRVYRCLRDKSCMMSRQKRNRCQYCRMLKCLQVGMNRKAIREDGMPGGRNKSIGPVKLTPEEIERIMTGEEYELESDNKQMIHSPTRSDGISDQLSPTSFSPGSAFSPAGTVGARFEFPALSIGTPNSAFYRARSASTGDMSAAIAAAAAARAAVSSAPLAILPEVEALVHAERAHTIEPLSLPMSLDKNQNAGYPELFELLCKLMDKMIYKHVQWSKNLQFHDRLNVPDLTLLLSNSWCESMLLSTLHSQPANLFHELAVILNNYIPSEDELRRFGQEGLEIIDMATAMVTKYQRLRVSFQEFACLKVINFLNPETEDLADPSSIEELSKRQYYVLHDHVQLNNNEGADRFRELLLIIPDIRQLARKIKDMSFENAPLLFKAIMHACNAKK